MTAASLTEELVPCSEEQKMTQAFARTSELLLELADHIDDTKLLLDLCLVNRLFHNIFSYRLHRDLTVTNICREHDGREICLYDWRAGNLPNMVGCWQYFMTLDFNNIPNLRHFECRTALPVNYWLMRLVNLHKLESLYIHQPHLSELDRSAVWPSVWPGDQFRGFGSSQAFANLKSLRLEGVQVRRYNTCSRTPPSELNNSSRYIAELLLNAAGLEHLHIEDHVFSRGHRHCKNVFTFALGLYLRRSRGRLVRLKSLHLGRYIQLPSAKALSRATDTTCLEYLSFLDVKNNSRSLLRWLLRRGRIPRLRSLRLEDIYREDWDTLLPAALKNGTALWARSFRYDEYDSSHAESDSEEEDDAREPSEFELARQVRVPMLQIPSPCYREPRTKEEVHHLRGCTWLTHLIIPVRCRDGQLNTIGQNGDECEPTPADFEGYAKPVTDCVPEICGVIATLPKLEALFILTQGEWQNDEFHHLDESTPRRMREIAQRLAGACPSLRIFRLLNWEYAFRRSECGDITITQTCDESGWRCSVDFFNQVSLC